MKTTTRVCTYFVSTESVKSTARVGQQINRIGQKEVSIRPKVCKPILKQYLKSIYKNLGLDSTRCTQSKHESYVLVHLQTIL